MYHEHVVIAYDDLTILVNPSKKNTYIYPSEEEEI